MRHTNHTHHTRLLRAAFATMATVLLFLTVAGVFFPVVPLAREGVPTAAGLSPDQSGSVVIPAGDASLPVALTGVNARAAVLMEAGSGNVIFGQNEDARLPMASTTKIMTALVALDALPLDTPVKITAHPWGWRDPPSILRRGRC